MTKAAHYKNDMFIDFSTKKKIRLQIHFIFAMAFNQDVCKERSFIEFLENLLIENEIKARDLQDCIV